MRHECKACTKARNKRYVSIPKNQQRAIKRSNQWYADNAQYAKARAKETFSLTKYRDREFRRKYGITLTEYHIMVDLQHGRCKICSSNETQLVVDHNHITGKVRGLLCSRCNAGLGMFGDNSLFLRRAAKYLEETNNVVI